MKKKKTYPILDFLKVKYHTKKKNSTVHTLNTNYYLKYLPGTFGPFMCGNGNLGLIWNSP